MSVSDIVVAVTGAVYVAPVGSPPPTSATSQLDSVWKDLGYISEDGVTEEHDFENEQLTAWQNSATVRSLITKYGVAYTLTPIETKADVIKTFYGDSNWIGSGTYGSTYSTTYTFTYGTANQTKHTIGEGQPAKRAVVIDVVDGTTIIRRYAPNVDVLIDGDVEFNATDAIGYPIRFDCRPDTALGGSVQAFYVTIR